MSPSPSEMINQRVNCTQGTTCAGSVILSFCEIENTPTDFSWILDEHPEHLD